MYEVVRVSSILCSRLNFLGEVNKPTTQNTRDANDFVHAKRLARKKPLLAGYNVSSVFVNCFEQEIRKIS